MVASGPVLEAGSVDPFLPVAEVQRQPSAGLLVPGYLIDLAFDTDIVTIVAQSMLAAFACAPIAMVWIGQKE